MLYFFFIFSLLAGAIIITYLRINFLMISYCVLILEMLIAIRKEDDVNEERVIHFAVRNNQIDIATVAGFFGGVTALKYFNADKQIWIA